MNGPLPPHRKVTVFGRVWIEEDLLAYGRQERAAERVLWQETAVGPQPSPMSEPNRLVAYCAAQKLRDLGYEWNEAAEDWVKE